MTTGILYVLHGRRDKIPSANLNLIYSVQARYDMPQAIGFLEGDTQTLEAQALALQEKVSHLIVIPVLLFPATHVLWDIPKRLAAICRPELTYQMLAPLGTTEAVFAFLREQLYTATKHYVNRSILLVAHGTKHFTEPFDELQVIGQKLQTALHTPVICANYVGPHQVQEVAPNIVNYILVQPLFLTDGRLVHKIEDRIRDFHPNAIFLPTLENNPALKAAILERLHDAGL